MEKLSARGLLAQVVLVAFGWVGMIGVQALAETVQTSFANLRVEPGPQGRIITALPKGTALDLLRGEGDYAEVRVTRTGLTGWVYLPAQGWRIEQPAAPAQTTSPAVAQPTQPTQPTQAERDLPVVGVAVPGARPQPVPDAASKSGAEGLSPLAEPELLDAANALPRSRGPWAYPLENGDAAHIPVGDLRLEMDPVDAQVLFRKDPNDRSAFPVRVMDGQGSHAGKVAVKGNFSRNFLKKSLLVALDRGQQAHGRSRFALNAMATDPGQVREWLAWDLIRKLGMAAPKAHYTHLFINGEFIGLYLDIEWMDAALFERLGLGEGTAGKSQFIEADGDGYCGDLTPASLGRGDLCWSKIAPRDGDLGPLEDMIRALNATPSAGFDAWLEVNFDVGSVIDWLVLNTLFQNGDSYNKNYFLHRAGSDGKWRVIPWDYDLTLGRVADPLLPFPRMIYNSFFQYALPPDLGAENPLKRKVFENPRLFARYKARLAQVLGDGGVDGPSAGWFAPQTFRQRLADLAALSRRTRTQEKYPAPGAEHADTLLEALAFFNEWRGHLLRATVLENTVFGSARWLMLPAPDALAQAAPALTQEQLRQRRHQRLDLAATRELNVRHARLPLVDPLLGWPLGLATLREASGPVRLTLETARESAPTRLPPGMTAAQCVERTWFATVKSEAAATLDLEFDYLHEASTRREVPEGLDESALRIYWFDGQAWRQAGSHVNGLANLVALPELRLMPDVANRFVVCVPGQVQEMGTP